MASTVNEHDTVDNNYATTRDPAHANATNLPSTYTQDHPYSSTAPLAAHPDQYQSPNTAPYPPQNTAAVYAPPRSDPAYPPPLNTAPVYGTNLNTASAAPSGPPPPYPGPNPNSSYHQPPPLTSTPNAVLTNDPSKYPGQPQQPYPAVLQVNTVSQQAPANVTVVRTVQVDAGPRPDNYLACSILSTIFCCLIFGIIAIVFSAQVHSHWSQGRYNEARRASAQARGWNIAAVVTGLVIIAFNMIRVFAFY